MGIVTPTVAACLRAFEVDEGKYNIIGQGSALQVTIVPSDTDLSLLIKGGHRWTRNGLVVETDRQSRVIKNLHVNDFVCLTPEDGSQLYDIAQIKSLNCKGDKITIVLAEFARRRNVERALLATGKIYQLEEISRVQRVCWVVHDGSENCDFTTTSPIDVCRQCQESRSKKQLARKQVHRLRTLSLFGGAGGMDVGLALSHCRTNWMIDGCAVSCQTFSTHHPSAKVMQRLVGDALVNMHSLETMPKLNEVDAIVMGPPCQSFSKINRQSKEQREQDPRSLCVATGLSYVETYRPTYGIIENVCGILENGNLGKVEGNGIVKFIFMCLATLGYRSRMDIVNCSAFGIPQSRKRLVIIFALESVTLPAIPPGTHAVKHKVGLYAMVTIADATSDLPRWDVANPAIFGPSNALPVEKRQSVPPSLRLTSTGQVKAPDRCRYLSKPRTTFQQQVRMGSSDQVADHHILAPFDSPFLSIERFWHIPCHPAANHLNLQGLGQLEIPELQQNEEESVFKNAFRRLDANEAFPIVMTSIGLRTKSGRMLMPDQHRTPSIRELARAQGFPDGIRFSGTPAEQLRQIGNAVPIPLAFALGESIVDAMIDDFLHGDRRFTK